jgi:hypothetical protein
VQLEDKIDMKSKNVYDEETKVIIGRVFTVNLTKVLLQMKKVSNEPMKIDDDQLLQEFVFNNQEDTQQQEYMADNNQPQQENMADNHQQKQPHEFAFDNQQQQQVNSVGNELQQENMAGDKAQQEYVEYDDIF